MKLFVLIALVLAIANAYPLENVENGDQDVDYYLRVVPLNRIRRQTKWGINNSGFGLSHTGTVFENQNHKVDATGRGFKSFDTPGLRPDLLGGRADYLHKPSGSGAFVSADHTRNWGTDVAAGVNYNIHRSKNGGVDLTGEYGQHFGGPLGNSKPQGGVFLKGHYDF